MSKDTFKSIGHPFEDFRDTSKNSSDAEFSDEDLKFSCDEKESSSDDELTNSRPEAPLNIPRYAPKIFRREAGGGLTNDIDPSSVSGRKRVIGSLDDLTTPLNDMNIDAGSATSQIPSLSCIPDPTTEVRKEKYYEEKAETTANVFRPTTKPTGKTDR